MSSDFFHLSSAIRHPSSVVRRLQSVHLSGPAGAGAGCSLHPYQARHVYPPPPPPHRYRTHAGREQRVAGSRGRDPVLGAGRRADLRPRPGSAGSLGSLGSLVSGVGLNQHRPAGVMPYPDQRRPTGISNHRQTHTGLISAPNITRTTDENLMRRIGKQVQSARVSFRAAEIPGCRSYIHVAFRHVSADRHLAPRPAGGG